MALKTVFLYLKTKKKINNDPRIFISGVVRIVPTHLGDINIRLINGSGNIDDKVPVICLPGANSALVDEWVPIAKYLSLNNFAVAIINFHSNPATKPGDVDTSLHENV